MGRRPRSSRTDARSTMRLLIAAAAVFVFLMGLTVTTYAMLVLRVDWASASALFGFFFLVGLVLFAASAFINTETVKVFLDAVRPMGRANRE